MMEPLVEYIGRNYAGARRIVEVGVGSRLEVAQAIAQRLPQTLVVAMDWEASCFKGDPHGRVRVAVDDILHPTLPLYENSALLYAIRPPPEVVPAIEGLSDRIGSDLLVVPLAGERDVIRGGAWQRINLGVHVVGLHRQHPEIPLISPLARLRRR